MSTSILKKLSGSLTAVASFSGSFTKGQAGLQLEAVLASLKEEGFLPAEEINRAICVAARTNPGVCLELIELVGPSVLDGVTRRLIIQVHAEFEQWTEVLAAFEELGVRKEQADAAVVLHLLNALLSLSRDREALEVYEQLVGHPRLEEDETDSGSTASPTSSSSGRMVLPAGLLGALKLCEENMYLDARHHDAGMAACRVCGAWERAHTLLAEAAQRQGTLWPETYQCAMELFEAAGEWQLCLWTMQAALRANIAPTRGACVAALGALGVAGEWPRVVLLLDDILDWDVLKTPTSAVVQHAESAVLVVPQLATLASWAGYPIQALEVLHNGTCVPLKRGGPAGPQREVAVGYGTVARPM